MQIPRLRRWRERKGLTQKELAELAGVSERSVAGYESGDGTRPNTARKLADAMGVAVSDLMEAEAPKERGSSPGEFRHPATQEWLEERGLKYTAMGTTEFYELMKPGGIVAPPGRLLDLLQKVVAEYGEVEKLLESAETPPGGLTEVLRAQERAASRWFTLSAQSQIQAQQAASQAAAS